MISREDLQKIKKISQEFFEKMGLAAEIEMEKPCDSTIPIKLRSEEPKMLIGEGGQTLLDAQRLLRAILRRKFPEELFYIDLDINSYKERKAEHLRELAKTTADEVSLSRKEIILAPMPAYERRIIHLELAERADITSESIGQEPERRVVIRPYP